MSDIVRDWATKAEDDFRIVRRLCEGASPSANGICFHAQQCVEKLIKALLIQNGFEPPRIHDLEQLRNMLGATAPSGMPAASDLAFLNVCAVEMRYPGFEPEQALVDRVLELCIAARKAARPRLPKPRAPRTVKIDPLLFDQSPDPPDAGT